MLCPRCKDELRTVEVRGMQVDVCPKCQGAWYDQGELESIMKMTGDEVLSSDIAVTWDSDFERLEEPGMGNLECPRCGTQMYRYRYAGDSDVFIDGCENGHGVWLDDGELRKIFEYIEKAANVDPEKEAEVRKALAQILKESKEREEALIDSLVRWDNKPGPVRFLGYPLQFLYRVFYKLGL